jgi:hypothetical protein
MKCSQSILLASLLPLALAQDMQINIYENNDFTCVDGYQASFWPTTDGSCYNMQWGGSTSNAIVNCPPGTNCGCYFYEEPYCQGYYVGGYLDQCINNNFNSFQCWLEVYGLSTTTVYPY